VAERAIQLAGGINTEAAQRARLPQHGQGAAGEVHVAQGQRAGRDKEGNRDLLEAGTRKYNSCDSRTYSQ